MSKKSNRNKILGVALLAGAGVAGYFLYRQIKTSGGTAGYGLSNVNIRRGVKTLADRYDLKADVYRALMGKDVGGTSHQGVLPMKIGAYWTGHRVMGVRR